MSNDRQVSVGVAVNWQGVSAADRAFLEAIGDVTGDVDHGFYAVAGGVNLHFSLANGQWRVVPHWEEDEGVGATAESAYIALLREVETSALRGQTRLGRLRMICERVVVARAYQEKP